MSDDYPPDRGMTLWMNPALEQIAQALADAGIATEAQQEAFITSMVRQIDEREKRRRSRPWRERLAERVTGVARER